jgi:hypothetical protein
MIGGDDRLARRGDDGPEREEARAPAAAAATAAPEDRRALRWLLAAMAAWSGWLIFRTSFVAGGRRVFCLFDDAMISMTYARNLVEGHGLNWARHGAPVEGFTHPLWTALMVPVNLLPLPLDRRCLVVQLASLAVLLLHVALVRRLVLRHFTRPGARHWLPACALTAFYYPLAFWSLIGMETGLQALLTTASVLLALDIAHCRRNRHLALLLVGAAAVLVRADMVLVVAAVQLYLLAVGALPRDDGSARRGWLLGAAALAAVVVGYSAFRLLYFHDLLPNTYYLKLGGIPLVVRLLRGGGALLDTLRAPWPLLLAVGIGVAAQLFPVAGRRGGDRDADPGCEPGGDREWSRRLALPAMIFVLCCAYSVYVGGDAWEDDVSANRFVAFAMPQVFVLFNALLNQAVAAWRRRRGSDPPALRHLVLAVTVAALLAADGLWQRQDAEESWRQFTGVTRPTHADKYRDVLDLVHSLKAIAEPTALVAVVWAGTPAYFSDFRLVDTLGYNDRHIARGTPVNELTEDNFEDFLPGHVKWDYPYLIDRWRPDAFLQLWGGPEVVRLLRARGYRRVGDLWIDPASPRIHPPPALPPAAIPAPPAEAAPPSEDAGAADPGAADPGGAGPAAAGPTR